MDSAGTPGSTADGLVILRAGSQAQAAGLTDPHAGWFVSEAGHQLVRMATEVDPVYAQCNLARFLHTSARLRELAGEYTQVVLLGAGFDTRALWLEGFQDGHARIYELDSPAKLAQKREQLARHGISPPGWNPYIGCDLQVDPVEDWLRTAGLDAGQPTLVLAEGVLFYLRPEVTQHLLDPRTLSLADGSRVLFDCWSAERVAGLNQRLAVQLEQPLFQPFPWALAPEQLVHELARLGYRDVQALSLKQIAEQYYGPLETEGGLPGWWLVEAGI